MPRCSIQCETRYVGGSRCRPQSTFVSVEKPRRCRATNAYAASLAIATPGAWLVQPERPAAPRHLRQRPKDGLGPAEYLAGRFNELHPSLKRDRGDLRVSIPDHLRRRVFDAIARQALPVADPDAAERAIAIEDEDGALRNGGHSLD